MKIKDPILTHEYSGLELDWIGFDETGAIGYFCSGGEGLVPHQALESAPQIDQVTELIIALPKSSEISIIEPLKEWEEIGKRGLYVFDWSRQMKAYKAVVIPIHPVFVTDEGIDQALQKINPAMIDGRFSIGIEEG